MGEQQIGAGLLTMNWILLFFQRPFDCKSHEPDINYLLKLCDMNNIPFATNLGTAEILIKVWKRGFGLRIDLINKLT